VNPGGERFRKEGDYCGKATEWLLVAVTMFAITGLVNTVWVANVRALAQVPPRPIVESPSITVTTASDDNDVVVGLFLTGTSGVTEEDDGDDVGHDEDDEQFAFHLME